MTIFHFSSQPDSKVVLITGASSGIGEATARHLAELGRRVALGARRTDRIASIVKEIQKAGGRAVALELDVTDLESMRAFVSAARERFGRVAAISSRRLAGIEFLQD